jgi:hypothetical protein
MKRIICITICTLFALNFVQAKKVPDFVQQRLDSIQKETKRSLMDYRIWNLDRYMTLPRGLSFFALSPVEIFSYDETLLIEDTLKLNLSVGMIYDNEMRERLVQLLLNEYQDWELDTLVNRQIGYSKTMYEEDAMKMCRFDTLTMFKMAIDSFYLDVVSKSTEDSKKHLKEYESFYKEKYRFEVFKSLQLDTTIIFKQVYNKIVEQARERIRKEWLADMYSYFTSIHYLAELCGYIGDKRFIKPLIEILDKLEKFFVEEDSNFYNFQREKVLEALARMRVKPYYTDYVKKKILTMEQIKDEKKWLDFSLDDFVYVLGDQKAFLELSKYLLSNKPYQTTVIDYDDRTEYYHSPVSQGAFYLIQDNIENEDLQKIISPYREDFEVLLKPLYDWMQKNYGKYKIRRIW